MSLPATAVALPDDFRGVDRGLGDAEAAAELVALAPDRTIVFEREPGAPLVCTPDGVMRIGPAAEGRVAALLKSTPELAAALRGCEVFSVRVLDSDDELEVRLELERQLCSSSVAMIIGRVTGPVRSLVSASGPVDIPSLDGRLRMVAVAADDRETATVVLVGRPEGTSGTKLYVHRGCVLGDALGSLGCPRRRALDAALVDMHQAGSGVILYSRDDARLAVCCAPNPVSERPMSAAAIVGFRAALAALSLTAVHVIARASDRDGIAAMGLDVELVTER